MANEIKAKNTGSVSLFGDDLQKGFENMTQEDMALPLSESWDNFHHK